MKGCENVETRLLSFLCGVIDEAEQKELSGHFLTCTDCRHLLEKWRQSLLALRAEEKDVFLLRAERFLTYEEIAEMRHCPVGTIKMQMRAAVGKLRKVLV